ncbi:IS30 family transposase [Aestuariimicrobium soli]|uniref:IS30 family transposase n=1 Tax=Aestuariimicrobium soli TaxID=2035834 RepID=UPI003EBA7427
MDLKRGRHGGLVVEVEVVRPVLPHPAPSHGARLSLADRTLIHVGLVQRWSLRRIAGQLGVSASTVSREIARNSTPTGYRAEAAETAAAGRRGRPKRSRLDDPVLRQRVVEGLNSHWSPRQVSIRLAAQHGKDGSVSHETIYQALYVQGRGSLREELRIDKALRSGRTHRIPHSKLPPRTGRPWLQGHHISTRPAEAADRAIPGHWEGDLVLGARNQTAIITLVERASRFVLLHRLPDQHDSTTVVDALIAMAATLPAQMQMKSLTWDQGSEMAEHPTFSLATHTQVYFCDPHSPWQRGSNENTNGLIRDFWPKPTDFAQITDAEILHVQNLLNDRPRETLNALTPREKLQQLLTVALTD